MASNKCNHFKKRIKHQIWSPSKLIGENEHNLSLPINFIMNFTLVPRIVSDSVSFDLVSRLRRTEQYINQSNIWNTLSAVLRAVTKLVEIQLEFRKWTYETTIEDFQKTRVSEVELQIKTTEKSPLYSSIRANITQ